MSISVCDALVIVVDTCLSGRGSVCMFVGVGVVVVVVSIYALLNTHHY